MQTQDNQKYEIQFPGLPLAVYEEIAAHLRQVEGVQTGLYLVESGKFDYNQSQVECLWLQYIQTTSPQNRERVEQILAYYRDRYGEGVRSQESGVRGSPSCGGVPPLEGTGVQESRVKSQEPG